MIQVSIINGLVVVFQLACNKSKQYQDQGDQHTCPKRKGKGEEGGLRSARAEDPR